MAEEWKRDFANELRIHGRERLGVKRNKREGSRARRSGGRRSNQGSDNPPDAALERIKSTFRGMPGRVTEPH